VLVDRVLAQWALLPRPFLLEVQILQEARVAEQVTALRDTWRDHEASRLHTDRALRLFIGCERARKRVDNLDHIFPLDDSPRVAQVLDIAALLLLCKPQALLFGFDLALTTGGFGLREAIGLSEGANHEFEGCLHILLLGEGGCIGGVSSGATTASLTLMVRVLIVAIVIRLEAE